MTGSIVLATDQGLGYLAKDFYDNGIIQKVFIQPHSTRKNHYEWYGNDRIGSIDELLECCDTLFFFEEVFQWQTIPKARQKGIKTVLMPMYECTRSPLPYEPDLILCPSLLDLDYFIGKNAHFIPVPTNVRWKRRKNAEIFVHNAGNGGLGGRNGTQDIIEAMRYVDVPLKLIIRSQVPIKQSDDPRIEYRIGQFDDIWNEGDVFLFPERFNGLSLPLQEAFASGMLVMAGDRYPINTWLPNEPLIPVDHYVTEKISVELDSARFDPKTIAQKMCSCYGADIEKYSLQGREWAKQNSWKALKETYETALSAW